MQPLNPRLHAALLVHFGRVEVTNPGQLRMVSFHNDPRPGRVRTVAAQAGEEYRVNCPFCRDRKARLYVNHAYAEYDPRTGDFNFHLLNCFHAGCQEVKDNRAAFRRMVLAPQHGQPPQPIVPAVVVAAASSFEAPPLKEVPLPADLTALSDLPPDHPAVVYLAGRRFQPETLWSRWRVSYCRRDAAAKPKIVNRIVVPIYAPGGDAGGDLLVGWQARVVSEPRRDQPKYLTAAGMPKSRILYNLPGAIHSSGPVFVCEGVTDCWHLGSNAVALFGKTVSSVQRRLLVRHFKGRPIVLFLDQDAQLEAEKALRAIGEAREAASDDALVVLADLPPGRKDVGDCSQEEALDQAENALGMPAGALRPLLEAAPSAGQA